MPILRERLETALPIEEAFAFVADFENSSRWDPGVASSERLNPGPVGVGARYQLGVRLRGNVSPMEYEVTAYETPRRVVLAGKGSFITAVDEIRFEPLVGGGSSGTRIDYVADIRLTGLARLMTPFLGGAFAKVGSDAVGGMKRTLDELASQRSAS